MTTRITSGNYKLHIDSNTVVSTVIDSLFPSDVQTIIDRFDNDGLSYDDCRKMEAELNDINWSCDWGLDAIPFDIKPLQS
jgi:hypothetical protein